MRLFVALEIHDAVRESLAVLIKDLHTLAPKARWVRAENLHLTLKFIGEVAPEKVECIRKTLSAVRSEQGVALQFRGLGFFPNEKRPRVFWVSMDCSPNLKLLASNIEGVLEKLGIPREQRLFVPHLTLARFDPPGISEKLRAAVHENIARDFGAMQTSEFHLIESKLKPTGAEYTTLQSFPFVVAEA